MPGALPDFASDILRQVLGSLLAAPIVAFFDHLWSIDQRSPGVVRLELYCRPIHRFFGHGDPFAIPTEERGGGAYCHILSTSDFHGNMVPLSYSKPWHRYRYDFNDPLWFPGWRSFTFLSRDEPYMEKENWRHLISHLLRMILGRRWRFLTAKIYGSVVGYDENGPLIQVDHQVFEKTQFRGKNMIGEAEIDRDWP